MTVLFTDSVYDPAGGAWGLGTLRGYPCAGDISSKFGATDMDEHAEGHNGTDIAADQGIPILAPCDMLITDVFSLDVVSTDPLFQQIKDLFGNSVWATILRTDGTGWRTMFAHMAEPPSVVEGAPVAAGTLLGYVGSTGMSTGPHLHWVLGPLENRWLARGAGNVEVLDYCATGLDAPAPKNNSALIKALQEARAAIDRASALAYLGGNA